jgi:tRNA-2-methylthio-N6-dimethylallyladenosine synthase
MNEKAEIDNKKRPLRPVLPSQNCKGDTQKVFVKTFGCQMNKYDSEILKGLLKNNRFDITDEIESADIALFNTCSVREHAENRVYGQVGSLKKLKSNGSPLKIIGIIGCMAQAHKEEIFKRLPHVDLVCGPQNLYNVVDYLQDIIDNNKKIIAVDGKQRPADVDNCKLRNKIKGYEAFVTIMEGCDNFCSFCIVPFVRGRERSRPPALIIKEIEELLKKGIKEITLLGQNVNSYGKGLKHNYSFVDLLEKIDKIGNLQRLRFITSHPKDAESKLFKTMARLPSACESLHLAVQSGSNKHEQKLYKRGISKES